MHKVGEADRLLNIMIRFSDLDQNNKQTKTNKAAIGRVLVFGNQKGGSGKSTLAMHCAIGLLRLGFKVGTIDLDGQQASLSRYLKNRFAKAGQIGVDLPSPTHIRLYGSEKKDFNESRMEEGYMLTEAINELQDTHDFIIIDTAGQQGYIYDLAHSFANTIITPINDSFIDLDVIADIDPTTMRIKGPSQYAAMVWKQRQNRLSRRGGPTEWIILRNRMARDEAERSQDIEKLLEKAGSRFLFKTAPGFTERAVFRDMFLSGTTLLDWQDVSDEALNLDILQARQEVRRLLETIGLRKKALSRRASSRARLDKKQTA